MNDIYVMQRANGDVFTLDQYGRFRVPLFHSGGDAMIARSRNWEMLLFKPVALDARLLKELVPIGDRSDVDFWLVNDPLANLNRGHLVEHAQLALLIRNPIELQILRGNGDGAPMEELVARYQNEVATTAGKGRGYGSYTKSLLSSS